MKWFRFKNLLKPCKLGSWFWEYILLGLKLVLGHTFWDWGLGSLCWDILFFWDWELRLFWDIHSFETEACFGTYIILGLNLVLGHIFFWDWSLFWDIHYFGTESCFGTYIILGLNLVLGHTLFWDWILFWDIYSFETEACFETYILWVQMEKDVVAFQDSWRVMLISIAGDVWRVRMASFSQFCWKRLWLSPMWSWNVFPSSAIWATHLVREEVWRRRQEPEWAERGRNGCFKNKWWWWWCFGTNIYN